MLWCWLSFVAVYMHDIAYVGVDRQHTMQDRPGGQAALNEFVLSEVCTLCMLQILVDPDFKAGSPPQYMKCPCV